MSSSFGRLDRDLLGRSLMMHAKLVLDEECNLSVANATVTSMTIEDTLFVGKIFEEEALMGIAVTGDLTVNDNYSFTAPTILGNIVQVDYLRERATGHGIIAQSNVCVEDDYVLKVSTIQEQVTGNGLVIKNAIHKEKFGVGRVHLGSTHTIVEGGSGSNIVFGEKTFESGAGGLIHPSGNTSITFQAPSTTDVNCEYGNALVRAHVNLGVHFVNGEATDTVKFRLVKNKSDIVSEFTHDLMGPCVDADQTFAWTDIIKLLPEETLDVYAVGTDISGNLDADILGGTTTTFASFEVVSLE